jgi:hypothetical protein
MTRRACSRPSRTQGRRVAGLLAEVDDDRAVATSSSASSKLAAPAITTAMLPCEVPGGSLRLPLMGSDLVVSP